MYSVGIGKEIPTTTLDVADTSVNDIITVIKEMANINQLLNLNINIINNSNLSNLTDIANTIETLFIDPSTNKKFIQVDNKYFTFNKISYSDYSYVLYNYILKTVWKNEFGKRVDTITIPETKLIIKYTIESESSYNYKFLFNNSSFFYLYDWIYGKKFSNVRVIKKEMNISDYLWVLIWKI